MWGSEQEPLTAGEEKFTLWVRENHRLAQTDQKRGSGNVTDGLIKETFVVIGTSKRGGAGPTARIKEQERMKGESPCKLEGYSKQKIELL